MEIRPLLETDQRSGFHSGDPDLDEFFHRYVGQNQFRHHVGVTYVAISEEQILGYCTVSVGQIEFDRIPQTYRKKLPRYPLPVLRLARLAVDARAQGRRCGEQLLKFVLELAIEMAGKFGCVGTLVDAKIGAVPFYAKYGFVPVDVIEGALDTRPRPVPMYLSLNEIIAARGNRK